MSVGEIIHKYPETERTHKKSDILITLPLISHHNSRSNSTEIKGNQIKSLSLIDYSNLKNQKEEYMSLRNKIKKSYSQKVEKKHDQKPRKDDFNSYLEDLNQNIHFKNIPKEKQSKNESKIPNISPKRKSVVERFVDRLKIKKNVVLYNNVEKDYIDLISNETIENIRFLFNEDTNLRYIKSLRKIAGFSVIESLITSTNLKNVKSLRKPAQISQKVQPYSIPKIQFFNNNLKDLIETKIESIVSKQNQSLDKDISNMLKRFDCDDKYKRNFEKFDFPACKGISGVNFGIEKFEKAEESLGKFNFFENSNRRKERILDSFASNLKIHSRRFK